MITYRRQFDEGLDDEDERDEEGEYLLGEASEETDEGASLEHDSEECDNSHPEPHPDTERDELQTHSLRNLQIM